MALSPQRIRDTEFKQARRGYEPSEVDSFKTEVADALEAAQNEATAMEARARAAVARLQELSKSPAAPTGEADAAAVGAHASVDEAETISRTLLLAQRTADTTVAEANAEADRLLAAARADASAQLDAARAEAAQLVEDAKADARRAGESERVRVEGEVQALLARRDFLESDVDHLEQFLVAQRERITEAVAELTDLVNRVPNGLADMRRPLLSAAADSPPPEGDAGSEIAEITRVAEADGGPEDHSGGDATAADDSTGGADEAERPDHDDDGADDGDAGRDDGVRAGEVEADERVDSGDDAERSMPEATPPTDDTGDVWAPREDATPETGSLFEREENRVAPRDEDQ